MTGVAQLVDELEALGYEVEIADPFVVIDYTIDIGPLDGMEIRLGLDGSGHPYSPPSGPFISPWVLPLRPDGSPAPRGGVHDARGRNFPLPMTGPGSTGAARSTSGPNMAARQRRTSTFTCGDCSLSSPRRTSCGKLEHRNDRSD
ncbi:MAG: hypothetical protein ACP5H2_10920 [Solirubrobacteraceae bacterium]